jgi:hypothetical protein
LPNPECRALAGSVADHYVERERVSVPGGEMLDGRLADASQHILGDPP